MMATTSPAWATVATIVAWVAAILSKRAPSARFTYGLRGSSILAALFNAMFLLVAVGAIMMDSPYSYFLPM